MKLDENLVYYLGGLTKDELLDIYFSNKFSQKTSDEFLKEVPLGYGNDSIYYCDSCNSWLFISDYSKDLDAKDLFRYKRDI